MKKIVFILLSITVILSLSCKKEKNKSMTVTRDCTGTYLTIGETDYKVCNIESIAHLKDGTKVTVTYKPSKIGCTGQFVDCKTKHEFDSWIVIEKVK